MATYAGGNGETIEAAVIILNAASHQDGVRAEYEYIAQQYGLPHQDWQLRGQALLHHEGIPHDQMNIVLKDGTEKTIYFNISNFFGMGMESLIEKVQTKQQPVSPAQRFLGNIKRMLGMN